MKLTILSDDTAFDPALRSEHGFSVCLEKDGAQMLFDTGNREVCLRNSRKLGIDLRRTTMVAFSHNHRDHCGGFLQIAAELRPGCPVYAHTGFFQRKWWDHSKEPKTQSTYELGIELVGPPMTADFFFQNRIDNFRLLSSDTTQVGKDVYLLGNFPLPRGAEPVNPSSLMELPDHSFALDDFRDEQVLVVRISSGLVVISGCSHNGIINILRTVMRRFPEETIHAVFGGLHLTPPNPERIAATVQYIKTQVSGFVGVCHCTGPDAIAAFQSSVPCCRRVGAGFVWSIDD